MSEPDPQVHLRHHLNELLDEQQRLNDQIPDLHATLRFAEERLNEVSRQIDKTRSLIHADHPQCSCHVGDHDERVPRNRS